MIDRGTYVYCLIASPRRPSLRAVAKGIPGTGPVRLLAVESASGPKRWLAVADAPLSLYSESALNERLRDLDWVTKAAVAHEKVVEAFLAAPALLPMKLFTIFMSDARALEHLVLNRSEIDQTIRRVTNHEEWGLRVTLDRKRADPAPAKHARRGGSGSGYLASKKAQRDRAAELVVRAREVVADLYDQLAELATSAKRRSASELPVSHGPLLLDAAFLVPRGRIKRFRAAAERRARSLAAEGYHVAITGPWPPYSFLKG
jgi:hypothetical protein